MSGALEREATQVSWESRDGRGRYYTRTLRRGGLVVRQYLGAGPDAEAAAAQDAACQAARAAVAEARRAERARWSGLELPLQELCMGTDLILAAALVLCGFRRHDRGPWRRRRYAATT